MLDFWGHVSVAPHDPRQNQKRVFCFILVVYYLGMQCFRCEQEFEAADLVPYGRKVQCRGCRSAYAKQWREAHPDQVKAVYAAWCKKNPNRVREYERRKRKKNPERYRAKYRKRYAKRMQLLHGPDWQPKPVVHTDLSHLTPEEKRRRRLDQYNCNQKKRRAAGKTKLSDAAKRQNRRARERAAGGRIKKKDLKALWQRQGHICALCNQFMEKPSIDHIVPLSKGGTNDLSNLQLACLVCNLRKGAKVVDRLVE